MNVLQFLGENFEVVAISVAVVSEALGFTKLGGIMRALVSVFKKK